jgi:hypothetical protein
MQYFKTLPKIAYTNPADNIPIVVTNLLARASVIPTVLKNPLIYYQYDTQEGDTPEIIAHKYYGDPYRFWLILFSNQLLDPQWNWPLSYNQFNAYLNDKYNMNMDPNNPNPYVDVYGTVYQYQEVITQLDIQTKTTTVNTITIDELAYNTFVPSVQTYNLPTGPVQVTSTVNAISIYDWELSQNEAKRTINILNSDYADEMETELKKLMAQ